MSGTLPIDQTKAASAPFRVRFNRAASAASTRAQFNVDLPVLGDAADEQIFPLGEIVGSAGAFTLQQADGWLLGWASCPVGSEGLEQLTQRLYSDLFAAVRGLQLCRIWNYVPQINAHVDGQENYRVFCRGRARAFEAEFGREHFSRLCAASAVGSPDRNLAICFAAASTEPRHLENPAQVPAYRYPPEYGPRSPSFARATVTGDGRAVFISGTSSIKGHATIAPGDTAAQVACTLDNLALISRVAGLGGDLGANQRWTRHFKVYLRHAADLPAVKARLQGTLLQPGDHVLWLEAGVCRAELNVEIEATLMAV